MRAIAVTLLVAGCGRLGFDDRLGVADDAAPNMDVPANAIEISVINESATPVVGAHVLVDRGGPSLERYLTDNTGTLVVTTTTTASVHVLYESAAATWRMYSAYAVPPATRVALGHRLPAAMTSSMTVSVPNLGANFQYTPTLPTSCGNQVYYGSPTVTFGYASSCEGMTFHAFVLARDVNGSRVIDGGQLTLTNGSSSTISGGFVTPATTMVQATGVPAGFTSIGGTIMRTSDMMPLSYLAQGTVSAGATTFALAAAPGGDALSIFANAALSGPYRTHGQILVPATIGAMLPFDASQMLPQFTSLSLPPTTSSASWQLAAPSAATPAITSFHATISATSSVQWTVYGPSNLASVTAPTLPADLVAADPSNGTWIDATATRYVTRVSYASALATIERSPEVIIASSSITYSAGLGPP